MAAPVKILELHPIGGLDERWRPQPGAAALAEDLSWSDRGSLVTSGGFRSISDGTPFSSHGRINSLFWFAQHSGRRRWLIWETAAGELQAFNGSVANPTPTTCYENLYRADGTEFNSTLAARTSPSTPSAGTSGQAISDRLYLVNGYDEPVVFNGRYIERAGFATAPPAPEGTALSDDAYTTIKSLGLGAYGDGSAARLCAYRYKVAFVNERGQQSAWSEASGLIIFENPSTVGRRLFVGLAIPKGPPGTVARRIARTANLLDSKGEPLTRGIGESFYHLREIQDNALAYLEDGLPDTQLGELVVESDFGPWPMGARYLAFFKGTLFVMGGDGLLRYSAAGYPEVFPPDNVIDLGGLVGGSPTGLYASRNTLIVFQQRAIWLVKGDAESGFYAQPLTVDTGNAAPRSMREIPGLGLVFLADDGPCLLEGALEFSGEPTRLVRLSIQLPQTVERLNRGAFLNARAGLCVEDREYWLAVPQLGSTENNLLLVYHYDVGAWTTREGFPISSLAEARDESARVFFGSHSTSERGIQVYTRGAYTKGANGSAPAPQWRSSALDLGRLYRDFQVEGVLVQAVAMGDHDLQLDYYINRKLVGVRARQGEATDARDQQDQSALLDVYGTATWGTAKWGHRKPVILRFDAWTGDEEPVREFQIELTCSARRVEILAVALEVLGEKSEWLPLGGSRHLEGIGR